MVRIAYLLLCHRNAAAVIEQARCFLAAGDVVAIHFDRRGDPAAFAALRAELADEPGVAFARRVACGWGEWSLVQATLNLAEAARGFAGVTHHCLLSGDCYPTKSAAHLRGALAAGDRDYIEAHDFFGSGWIKTGIREERLIYRHYVNERKRPRLFYAMLAAQRWLGLRRRIPEGLSIRIGSQWWLLRAATLEAALAFLRERRRVARFFRTTWIPDEIMFQTIVAHLVPPKEIAGHPPTTLMFSDYGLPVVFCRDHRELLAREPRFFARKITPHDPGLRSELLAHYLSGAEETPGPETAQASYDYLAGRGRAGRRAAPRIWDRAAHLEDRGETLLIAAKKWHVGQRLAAALRRRGVEALGYVFDEDAPLPLDLGGLETCREKRGRHRRAFLSLLFDVTGVDKLALCVDPARDDVAGDFADADRRMRVLLIETVFSDEELADHAARVGLAPDAEAAAGRSDLLAALRLEFAEEAGRLKRMLPDRIDIVSDARSHAENVAALARFLRVDAAEGEAALREMEPELTREPADGLCV